MTPDDLMAFWDTYRRPSRKAAATLIGDRRRGFTTICGSLAGYAANKATAMRCRLKGDIEAAAAYEKICETIYEKLPKDLRW